jgi:hypothetical protein
VVFHYRDDTILSGNIRRIVIVPSVRDEMANKSTVRWSKQTALRELDRLIAAVQPHQQAEPYSADYIQWKIESYSLLRDVFGEDSIYFKTFNNISWQYVGRMILEIDEMLQPGAGEKKYNSVVYAKALTQALGILSAARAHLDRHELDNVYEGKDTGPEASLILRVIDLAEVKLRKVLRDTPTKERQVQDAFENLLIGADVPYSREKETIEYSSKAYIPDFTSRRRTLRSI